MLTSILQAIKKCIPKPLFDALNPSYHYTLALLGAIVYRFPSKKLTVIAVTGTKGKSSTVEMLNAIFEAAGKKTAVLGTIRFKIGDHSRPNKFKMTVPGRFFIQKFLRQAVNATCDVAIIELSSEAAKQFRHKFVYLDALVFTNLSPEHIESHGSFEKYREAKLALTESLRNNLKTRSMIVANVDDKESGTFLNAGAREKYTFSIKDAGMYEIKPDGISFTFKNTRIESPLRGMFNIYNCLGAATCADAFGIPVDDIKKGLENLSIIKGRVEFVKLGQDFDVVVDYAHTSGSLTELYKTFDTQKKICVLGNTGGGRDKWKRPEMARVADTFCDEIILTNEDPYDEAPDKILEDMLPGFKLHVPDIIMNRREAIAEAISRARSGDAVLITGKGTDPFIMIAHNKKIPWSDYEVAKEELEKLLNK
jgi:UDP-N-acetylmuramoyl-L-alanyl-D-glutamate--2,6-diaminopimelate ligase